MKDRDVPIGQRHVASQQTWSATDYTVGLLIAIVAALLSLAAMLRRPDLNAAGTFVFNDPGVNLLVAEKLIAGGRLYRDAGYSYGPLGIYPYAWLAGVAGNTPQVFSGFLGAISILNVFLAYLVLRRSVSRRTAALVAIVGLYPTILLPGSLIFGIQASGYMVIERVILLVILLVWRPPGERGTQGAAAVGILLGLWQGVRFGTGLFFGSAIVIVDLLMLYAFRANRVDIARWFRISLVTLAAFLAAELAWLIWAYWFLPPADARDFLWPSYALEAFRVWPSDRRWPRFENIRLFIGQQLLAVGCLGLGLGAVIRFVKQPGQGPENSKHQRGWRLAPRDCALMLAFVFYIVGAMGLFRSVYHFHQYAWVLPLTAALAVDRGGRIWGLAFLFVCIPPAALMLRANLVTDPPAEAVTIPVDDGGTLTVTPAELRRIDELRRYASVPRRRTLFIVPTGAGFHALFGGRSEARQMFYILGFARGRDTERMINTLETEPSGFVLTQYPSDRAPGPDPCQWYDWPHFSEAACAALRERVDVTRSIRVDETTWIIPGVYPGSQ